MSHVVIFANITKESTSVFLHICLNALVKEACTVSLVRVRHIVARSHKVRQGVERS